MEGKVALITGSSAGIGRAIALSLARLGCRLVIHGTNSERIQQVTDECAKESPQGHQPVSVVGDFDSDTLGTCESLIRRTTDIYKQLDILVNNAGFFQPSNFTDSNAFECFEQMMRINLNSAVKLTHLAAPLLRQSRGCVVNISSNLHAKCIGGGFAYCTAKAALTMFTKTVAVDLAPEVRVNSVSPGPVASLMSTRRGMDVQSYRDHLGHVCLTGRVGEPDEVARVVVFLASPESAYITGSDFIIDGGSTIKPDAKIDTTVIK